MPKRIRMEQTNVAHRLLRMPLALLVQQAVALLMRLLCLAVTLVESGAPGAAVGAAVSGAAS